MAEAGDEFESMTFEPLVAELESVTAKMAAGDIGIEAAAELYERAGRLHGAAADRLARVQERIDALAAGADPADPTDAAAAADPAPPTI